MSATLHRPAVWLREQGCGPIQAIMSDNAKCYATSHAFCDTVTELDARHILIPPYTPRWNGKIERFFGTLDQEWAHGRLWPTSAVRDRALSSFMRFYNRKRPHTAAAGRPPITRVHQVAITTARASPLPGSNRRPLPYHRTAGVPTGPSEGAAARRRGIPVDG